MSQKIFVPNFCCADTVMRRFLHAALRALIGMSGTTAGAGSEPTAAGGGSREASEWPQSACDAGAPPPRSTPGTATGPMCRPGYRKRGAIPKGMAPSVCRKSIFRQTARGRESTKAKQNASVGVHRYGRRRFVHEVKMSLHSKAFRCFLILTYWLHCQAVRIEIPKP